MTPRARKLLLTAHVVASVAWLGATLAFLALALIGITSQDELRVRGDYLAAQSLGTFVILPLSLTSLATGLWQGLGTKWGLFRHYWIVFKLGINVFSTIVLIIHLQPINATAQVAAAGPVTDAYYALKLQLVVAAALASLALLLATTLAVFKPRGMTKHGRRKQREDIDRLSTDARTVTP